MNSEEIFNRAKKVIPGGVNSPVRAFKGVGGTPFFTRSADGCFLYTQDDKKLIDFVSSWGPALFGHNNEKIQFAISEALQRGTSFGTPSLSEVLMAEKICSMIDSCEMVRMVNSGTEATMSACRLARGYTKKDKIVKFAGCYHGHTDSLLVKAGSGAMTFGAPDSKGIPAELAKLTIVLPFNDIEKVKNCFEKEHENIACVILEPFPANVGLILPQENFLKELRNLCTKYNILLIFDEVITGFRLSRGGAQKREGVTPDITTLGKIIGGGLPVGAFGGKREIMENLSPLGEVYQAGTLSGNPLCMAAGLAALDLIDSLNPYEDLKNKTQTVVSVIKNALKEKGIASQVHSVESLFSVFFTDKKVLNYEDALTSDVNIYKKYFHNCLDRGLYLAPSAFECAFMSLAHTAESIDNSCEIITQSIKSI